MEKQTTFTADDILVGAVLELIAIPLCDASWHAIMGDEPVKGIIGLLFGIPIGLAGLSFHWWKAKITPQRRELIGKHAPWGVLVALLVFLAYMLAPDMYRRATAQSGAAPSAEEIAQAVIQALPKTTSEPASVAPPQRPVFLSDISLSLQGPENLLVVSATLAKTIPDLRVYVDSSSEYGGSDAPPDHPDSGRVRIFETTGRVKGENVTFPLVSRSSQQGSGLRWGNTESYVPTIGAPYNRDVYARLVMVDPSGQEQHFYFKLESIPMVGSTNQAVLPFLYRLEPQTNWTAAWEKNSP